MELIKVNIKGLTVKLWEKLSNRYITGRSIYTITIEDCEGGIHIKDLGDDKEKALNYYRNIFNDIIDIELIERGKENENY